MDLERTMEFIVNQQVQFAGDIQLLKERQAALQQAALQQQQAALQQQQAATQNDIRSLVDVVTSLARLQEDLVQKVAGTDNRLNLLIGVVERHVSSHK